MVKVHLIKAETEEELVNNINIFNSQNRAFATQPIQKNDNSWIALMYCNGDKTEIIKEIPNIIKSDKINNSKINISNKEDVPATKKQLFFLRNEGVAIPEGLTKAEAFNLIKEIKTQQA